ncbi:MAG: class IV adenylate cyclase [Desulfovibrio sp.]|jgi:adenylate cyclase class 2|nr:class IV adenylate cyclase [Desulfovibrio sp.]
MSLEIECKYLNVDFNAIRSALETQEAHFFGAHFERNVIFDTPGAELFRSKRLLRLRTQEWPDKTRCLLTLKLTAEQRENFKIRDELETEVADSASLRSVLEDLGYSTTARYEKIREIWRLETVEVCLDVLPFMTALELEGEPENIIQAAELLYLDKWTASTKNYHVLHQDWRSLHNMPVDLSFVFNEKQRNFWRKKLGLAREV